MYGLVDAEHIDVKALLRVLEQPSRVLFAVVRGGDLALS